MTFDQSVLIWCVAVPLLIAAVGCLVSKFVARVPRALIVSLGWWLAVTAALAGCQEWQWWPEDAWRQAIWPLLAWVVVISATVLAEDRISWRWVAAGTLSIITAAIAMPIGQGWEESLSLHRSWMGLIALACLVNSFALERLSKSGGHRWSPLVALAGLGGPMALAAANYGSLAQWNLSIIVATAVIAVWGIFSEVDGGLWSAAIPATVAAAGITAAARFYTYETYPAWVYAAALFVPVLVALVDLAIPRRAAWVRVLVAGVVSAAIVAACVWKLLIS